MRILLIIVFIIFLGILVIKDKDDILALAPYGILLICPVMMFFMMKKGGKHHH